MTEETVRGRPSRGDLRRDAIIRAATDAFLENGFAGTTLDMIIDRSGGSRRTLYEHFGNKEGLFGAVVGQCCQRILTEVQDVDFLEQSPRDALTLIGRTFLRTLLCSENIAVFRAVVAETARIPELGDIFYRSGPKQGAVRLAEYFRIQTERGKFRMRDPEASAHQFFALVRSELHFRALFYPDYVPSDEDINRQVESAVETFLNGVGLDGVGQN